MGELRIKGRALPIVDSAGVPIDDIDTDQIYHNAHLAVTEISEMGRYAFGNLKGWQDFPKNVKPCDILLVARNFGAGSSRQHAVDCFRALGVGAILGESFGAIYKRNAINSGFPILEVPSLRSVVLPPGDLIEVDFLSGEIIRVVNGALLARAIPFSSVQLDIFRVGGLFAYGKEASLRAKIE
jgi:3-isopropylmalate/(R)-2-methylmalate dehydratase small subunit